MNPLVGTWRLLSGEIRDSGGELCARFVHGRIHYTAAGLMSAQCATDRPLAYHAYYGSYEVQAGIVVHHLERSNLAAEEEAAPCAAMGSPAAG